MKRIVVLLLLLVVVCCCGHSQNGRKATFVFYNVENLFDLADDSLTADEEFTPEGEKRWTSARYYTKIDRIARTISAVGEWKMPALIGLCEVENRYVVSDLLNHRIMKERDYRILHRNSPDRRGIDVALLYDPAVFSLIRANWIKISFSSEPESTTREILHAEGVIFETDTLHLFINHWPSRWGGIEATQQKRADVALSLREYIDSLYIVYDNPNIIIAGDFNDNPVDASVYDLLSATENKPENEFSLVNLMLDDYHNPNYGSLKYKSDWEVYDQIIVSSALLNEHGLRISEGEAHIFHAPFLITEDERYMGTKPFRTYAGPRYLDGFSDHLPVYLEIVK